ncbi:MAG: dihydrofolate reductase [Bacteroidales bacterium]|nr:dihydrofolate reductase [Bacteroidales bacterium]
MTISIIVAIAENNAIGKNNDLLWHISEDLKRFKRLTTGHTVIMGKNTYLSLPKGALPDRTNVVITDDKKDHFKGCIMAYSIKDALQKCKPGEDECFIIGGGMIYRQFMPIANKLYLTKVHKTYKADIYYPEIDYSKWELLSQDDFPDHDPPYSYLIYQRIE